ncbi:MAG: hypothetical protein AAF368_15295, partial [Planctomycetota bacterium]
RKRRRAEELELKVNSSWRLVGEEFPYILGFWDLFNRGGFRWLPIIGQIDHGNVWIITSSLKARYILYAQDRLVQSLINANLEASYDQLANAAETLQDIDKIKIKSVLDSVASLGNTGILGTAKEEIIPLADLEESLVRRINALAEDGLTTVYQISTDYTDLSKLVTSGRLRANLGVYELIRDGIN